MTLVNAPRTSLEQVKKYCKYFRFSVKIASSFEGFHLSDMAKHTTVINYVRELETRLRLAAVQIENESSVKANTFS